MPLYRGFKKGSSTPPPLEPTRRVARPASKSRVDRSAEEPAAATPAAALTHDPLANPVVGWLAIVAGPGRGEILPLGYGVNDIGRGAGARIRLDYGDAALASGNQAAIIYSARSRRFYLQLVAADAWLDGQLVRETVELTGGEVLQLGQTRLRFVPLCGPAFDWHGD
ncbi:MAG TPA: FHA domain-containing protein [Candidatus Competibacteraceae bacterium]|nr:FHA domain-containing protein [Candidatus Competibacteraceae bacterium]HQD57005.1 FHA domain-containing protein [Candidatus Competibacteraceae bacterium]